MRRRTLNILLAVFALLSFGATGSGCEAADEGAAGVTQSDNAVIVGTVTNMDGLVIGNAHVEAGGVAVRTNDQGWFVLADVPPGARVGVTARADGYGQAVETVRIDRGESLRLFLKLPALESTQSFDAAAGTTVSTAEGSIELPADGYVYEDGSPVTGQVQVDVSIFGLEDRADLESFPGDFIGVDESGVEQPLETFGFLYVRLYQGENAVQLAPGATAGIRSTIATALRDTAPATIPLWSLDEETGIWVLEGEGVRQGDEYVGTVTHFTWYNWDIVYGPSTLTGRIVNGEGEPLPRAWAQHLGLTYNGGQRVFADAEGYFRMPVRADAQVHVWAEYQGATSEVRTESTPPAGQTREIGDLVISNSSGPLNVLITLSWGAEPRDLDTHLWVPASGEAADGFHLYYSAKGSLDSYPFAMLDTDDTSSFGPEVVSMTQLVDGRYVYCVYNFSGAPGLEDSEATVTYLDNWSRLNVLRAPRSNSQAHLWWKVLEISVSNGRPSPSFVNRYVAAEECQPQ